MQWDWQKRHLRLSVGELARFSLSASGEDTAGLWRAELGTHWHTVLQEQTQASESGWRFECPVKGDLLQDNWTFTLSGRIDQMKPGPGTALIREVKTVSRPLPAEEGDLREAYPHYFHQAMLYAFLHAQAGDFPASELLLLEISTGVTQTVKLTDEDLESLRQHLREVAGILEERRGHFARLRRIAVPPAFPKWRPGQEDARQALSQTLAQGKPVLFEAPTGFGKTGIILELALRRLAAGDIERIVVLTGKNTGHSPLLEQLRRFKEQMPELAVQVMRSRKDHELDAELESELSHADIRERWLDSGLSASGLLHDGILDLGEIRALGQRHGIPPWAITRMLLPYADVWIADYNYLFDSGVAQVLEHIPTFNPSRTLLVVDEAHNLPGRAARSRSHGLDARAIDAVQTEVQFARFPGKLARLLDQLLSLLKRQKPADELDPPAEADLMDLLREIDHSVRESSLGADEISMESRDWLWGFPALLQDWENPRLPMHIHAPGQKRVDIACLDASAAVHEVLGRFQAAVLMSATLRPWDAFAESIGFPVESATNRIVGRAPWLEGCFEMVVDARVDTRYQRREAYMDITAATIAATAEAGRGCTAVFFPSYRYAEAVMERLQFHHPVLRCEMQPRDLNLEEQYAFLESALLFDDVVFLILGSRFSEGVDMIGGRIRQAIVVSPALPEVNGLQRAREVVIPGGKGAAFRRIYLIPGMQKISQALGRLVRSPEQSAKVLLHGKRFMDPEYQDLLPEYLQPVDSVVTEEELARKWLRRLA